MYDDMDNQEQERQDRTAAVLSVGAAVVLAAALLLFIGVGRNRGGPSGTSVLFQEPENVVQESAEQTDPQAQEDGSTPAAAVEPQEEPAGQAGGAGVPAGAVGQGQEGAQHPVGTQGGPAAQEQLPQVNSISVTGDTTWMIQCEEMQLTAAIEPGSAKNQALTWKSSNEEAATVTQGGLVTSVGGGDAVITATAPNGVYVDYPLSVSSTQKWMTLSIRTKRIVDNQLGKEWAYSFKINGKDVTGEESFIITLGDTITFYSAAAEYEGQPVVGSVEGTYTVSEDGFENGFEVTQQFDMDVTGEEKDGSADVTVIFEFYDAI